MLWCVPNRAERLKCLVDVYPVPYPKDTDATAAGVGMTVDGKTAVLRPGGDVADLCHIIRSEGVSKKYKF